MRYAAAIGAAGGSLLLRAAGAAVVGERFPLFFPFLMVVLAAAYLGFGPAVAAAFASAVGVVFLFSDRDFLPNGQSVGLLPFLLTAVLVAILVEALRRVSRRAEERLEQLRDESARREREEEFSARLRAIVESSGDAIASTDLAGMITSWNHAAERMFGYAALDAAGHPVSMLTPPDRAEEEQEILAQIRGGGRVKSFETVRLNRDGAQLQVSLTISPIHDAQGRVSGISYIARDITERKKVEQRLIETQKLESLSIMAGGLAHEFNNLLTGIMGNTSLVLETLTEPLARERLSLVLREGGHAAGLVQQMLAFAGKGAFVIGRLNLSQIVEEMDPLLRTSISRTVALDLYLDREVPPIEGDRAQVQQLLMNLVLNAAESINGSGAVTIATRSDGGGRKVVLEVRDTGCGMDEATKARIFDPFFTTKFMGRGLGLAAVMGIIRVQCGEIEVESHPGRGSTFRVALPAARSAATPNRDR
jgi:PAS domain S-box-containing protein